MRKEASSSISYLLIFALILLGGIVAVFVLSKSKGMTNQRDVDDTLSTAVLGSLIMDDSYFFYTRELGNTVFLFRDTQEAYKKYKDIISKAINENEDFYKNLTYDIFITYEVEDGMVTITEFYEDGSKYVRTEKLGTVKTPAGEDVVKTSAYGKVSLDVDLINDSKRTSRDCYCTMEV